MAYDLFSYYAIKAFDLKKKFLDIESEPECWYKLNQFIDSMIEIKNERKKHKSIEIKYNEKN